VRRDDWALAVFAAAAGGVGVLTAELG